MKIFNRLVHASALLVVAACSKSADRAGAGSAAAKPDVADHVIVFGRHKPTKPTDPVPVHFDRFKVVTASFAPDSIEGGHATIELDLTSLHTDSSERDDDLKSPAYIDVAKFATVTIDVGNIRNKAGNTFAADATVSLRGVTKTYPVELEVLEQTRDSVRILGRHTFSRLDFSVGSDPAKDPRQQVDTELTIEMLMTIART